MFSHHIYIFIYWSIWIVFCHILDILWEWMISYMSSSLSLYVAKINIYYFIILSFQSFLQSLIHSFVHVVLPLLVCLRPHFSLEVRTRSSKGLLLYIAGKGEISLLALFMAGGKIKLSLGQNRIIHHKKKSNDGNWHRVITIPRANRENMCIASSVFSLLQTKDNLISFWFN